MSVEPYVCVSYVIDIRVAFVFKPQKPYYCVVYVIDISKLTPIKENLPEYVTFDQIKITLSILKYEYCVDVKTSTNGESMLW